MDETTRLSVIAACTDVVMTYATSVDARDWDTLMSVWAPDCEWVRPGQEIIGRDAARANFEGLEKSRLESNPHGHLQRHHVTTLRVKPVDADHAEATWYAFVQQDPDWDGTLPQPMKLPSLTVEYRTSFRRESGTWMIARHEATHVFRQ